MSIIEELCIRHLLKGKSMITVTAYLKIKPNQIQDFLPQMQQLIDTTWKEPGCIKYDLFRQSTMADKFLIFEQWTTLEDYLNHANGAPVSVFKEHINHLLAEPISAPKWDNLAEK